MNEFFVHNLISDLFPSDFDVSKLFIKNRKVKLIKVTDIAEFIRHCFEETKSSKVSGAHRHGDWEKGWSGDGVYYSDDEYNNLPYYFYKNSHVRIGQNVYEDLSGFVEYDLLRALQAMVFTKLITVNQNLSVFEFGCGTGSNIQYLSNFLPKTEFFGSDWAQSALDKLVKNGIVPANNVFNVNYFDDKTFPILDRKYIAFTNASLEQAGNDYKEFVDFLIKDPKCEMAVHIEPIRELLDLTNPLNVQSFAYAQQRQYLTGFSDYLENSNVEVIHSKDYGIGSKYINGYQVVIWKAHHGG